MPDTGEFHVLTIPFAQNRDRVTFSHVQITGKVLYKREESDGDWHIVIADPSVPDSDNTLASLDGMDFVVCEMIPEIPLNVPVLHSLIIVQGIYRWDVGHGWPEIHPITSWVASGALVSEAVIELPLSR